MGRTQENEDNVSSTYTLPLTPGQVSGYTENGLDFISGFAVESDEIESITEPNDLIDLFQVGFEGGPFVKDEPLYVLDLAAGPFVHARKAVGPLEEGAFLGGIFEVIPFLGNGVAKAGDVETDLLWIEPTRLTAGSQIWKFVPGGEPELVAAYHGIAYGWETEDGFKAMVPSAFLGSVIKRSWGEVPCDVEVGEDGKLEAITLVAPQNIDAEEGFTELESGLWGKRVAYTEDMEVYEAQKIGKVDGVPVRILRPLMKDGEMLAEVQALLPDALYTRARDFRRYAPGVFVKAVPMEGLTAQARTATPRAWDLDEVKPVAVSDLDQRDKTDVKALMPELFRLLINPAPDGFAKLDLIVQIVDQHAIFQCMATMPDGTEEEIKSLPTALIHYIRQLRINTADEEEGAFFLARLTFESNGNGNFGFNKLDKPMWAEQVAKETWEKDLQNFPRSGAKTPDWLIDAVSGKLQEGAVPAQQEEEASND